MLLGGELKQSIRFHHEEAFAGLDHGLQGLFGPAAFAIESDPREQLRDFRDLSENIIAA